MQSVTFPAFVILPTTSCPMALYSCSTLHTPQLLRTHPCIISSSPSITNWSHLLSMISFYSLLYKQPLPNSPDFTLRMEAVHSSERLVPTQQTIVLKNVLQILDCLILPCKVSHILEKFTF
jgi:hypothetical protein